MEYVDMNNEQVKSCFMIMLEFKKELRKNFEVFSKNHDNAFKDEYIRDFIKNENDEWDISNTYCIFYGE